MPNKHFVIISGPSCVGKGPLIEAVKRFRSNIPFAQIPVIKSTESRLWGPRPDEADIWNNPSFFRPAQDIYKLKDDPRYIVGNCLGLPQAIDLALVREAGAELLVSDIYYAIGIQVAASPLLQGVKVTTVFLAPLSQPEMDDLKAAQVNLADYLIDVMLHKQLARARYHGKPLTAAFVADALIRARDTVAELASRGQFSHVIVNHDGEGNPNWHRTPSGAFTALPEGDAGRAVKALSEILSARA